MATAREDIIRSIRLNLATSIPFDAVHEEHNHVEVVAGISPLAFDLPDLQTLCDNFCSSAEMLGIHVEIADDKRAAVAVIESVIKRTHSKKIAISNSALIEEVVANIASVEFTVDPTKSFLFDSDLGITSAQWAVAETGTLVLEAEVEDHRLISLLPPVHLCLLEASKIRQTMGEILKLTQGDLGHTTTFVTGASRTSDIELTLAIGVHGPGELHIIILADR